MPVKIRLQRHGKKGRPFFHIVVADARAPRDGRYIERLGSYNPNTNPATIDIDVDSAASWLQKGAQPTDTARAILSYRGVLYRNHLNRGVLKGALSQEEADKKFDAWVNEKESKIQAKIDRLANESDSERKARLAAEAEANQKRADEIAAKQAPPAEEAPEADAAPEAPEAVAEAPVAEEAPAAEAAPVVEEKAEEATAAEEKAEAAPAVEEKAEEAPAAEEKAEEAPAAEEKKEEAPAAEEKKEEAPAEEAPKAEAAEDKEEKKD